MGAIAVSRTPAANGPHSRAYCWPDEAVQPDDQRVRSVVCRMKLEHELVQREHEGEISAITASTGVARGRITPQNTCVGVAPSTRADSSSSFGTVSKKPLMSHVFTPSAPPR